ncbi:MAG: hypothetical protein ABIR77_04705 [Sphingomicrobium sp.]
MRPTRLSRFKRLFTIKTRFEAYLVIYAIALGAVERGRHYLDVYPGFSGWLLAVACTGVVFVAGAKLLDSVRTVPAVAVVRIVPPRRVSRNRPRSSPRRSGSGSAISLRKD